VTLIYGISVLGQPLPNRALAYLHPDIWWGAVMLAVGAFYSIRFYPRNTEKK
jgi:hypothetical protein